MQDINTRANNNEFDGKTLLFCWVRTWGIRSAVPLYVVHDTASSLMLQACGMQALALHASWQAASSRLSFVEVHVPFSRRSTRTFPTSSRSLGSCRRARC